MSFSQLKSQIRCYGWARSPELLCSPRTVRVAYEWRENAKQKKSNLRRKIREFVFVNLIGVVEHVESDLLNIFPWTWERETAIKLISASPVDVGVQSVGLRKKILFLVKFPSPLFDWRLWRIDGKTWPHVDEKLKQFHQIWFPSRNESSLGNWKRFFHSISSRGWVFRFWLSKKISPSWQISSNNENFKMHYRFNVTVFIYFHTKCCCCMHCPEIGLHCSFILFISRCRIKLDKNPLGNLSKSSLFIFNIKEAF